MSSPRIWGVKRDFLRFLLVIFTIILAFSLISTPAQGAVKRAYAAIVVDAKSGKTLYSRAADAKRYPASITKVMTLYIVFQELEAGRLKLSTKMRVSKYAASAVPSKIGLRPGSTISVENAIKALVTKSANDVARVVAEHISGSEAKFAQRMTKVARALGMSRTTYRNASGLPDSRQVTTVRDQSRLGIAIYQHFPKYYKYFQTRTFRYKGRNYGNHNRLLGQNGIDGIKTGYIRASGYNLLTASRKNNRHIVVVAFGFDSGTKRNAKVASLVNKYLPKARRGNYVAQAKIAKPNINGVIRVAQKPVRPMPRIARAGDNFALASNNNAPIPKSSPQILLASAQAGNISAPIPAQRPVNLLVARANINKNQQSQNLAKTKQTQQQTNIALANAPTPAPIDIIGQWINESITIEQDNNGAILLPPIEIGAGGQAIDLLTSGSISKNAAQTAKAEPTTQEKTKFVGWKVQIGTANSENEAQNLIAKAAKIHSPLKNLRPLIEPLQKNGKQYYRARFVGFGTIEQAQDACNKLNKREVSCLALLS